MTARICVLLCMRTSVNEEGLAGVSATSLHASSRPPPSLSLSLYACVRACVCVCVHLSLSLSVELTHTHARTSQESNTFIYLQRKQEYKTTSRYKPGHPASFLTVESTFTHQRSLFLLNCIHILSKCWRRWPDKCDMFALDMIILNVLWVHGQAYLLYVGLFNLRNIIRIISFKLWRSSIRGGLWDLFNFLCSNNDVCWKTEPQKRTQCWKVWGIDVNVAFNFKGMVQQMYFPLGSIHTHAYRDAYAHEHTQTDTHTLSLGYIIFWWFMESIIYSRWYTLLSPFVNNT